MALSHPPLRFILAAAFGGIALLAALATSLLAGNAASRRVEANQFAMLDTAASRFAERLDSDMAARWRDVQHTIPFILQVGLFVTPVIYRNTFVPEKWRWIVALNPLTAPIEVFLGALLGLPMPEARVLWTSLAVSIAAAAFGFWRFTHTEAGIVDVV